MDTNNSGLAAHSIEWAAAFRSDDPAQQWAASCSVAGVVTAADRWLDSTALYEAACGAFDAAAQSASGDPVPAAVAGARRALYWERQERIRLVPTAQSGAHRWRAMRVADRANPGAALLSFIPVEGLEMEPLATRAASPIAEALADRLNAAGWHWSTLAIDGVDGAIEAAIDVGRDRAATVLADRQPALLRPVADGLVLLVAGSRCRLGRAWPGVVWLQVHSGTDAALTDPGTRAVIKAVIRGRRVRPTGTLGAAIRHPDLQPAVVRGSASAARDLSRAPGRALRAVAS